VPIPPAPRYGQVQVTALVVEAAAEGAKHQQLRMTPPCRRLVAMPAVVTQQFVSSQFVTYAKHQQLHMTPPWRGLVTMPAAVHVETSNFE
jgi:hypothetical protein